MKITTIGTGDRSDDRNTRLEPFPNRNDVILHSSRRYVTICSCRSPEHRSDFRYASMEMEMNGETSPPYRTEPSVVRSIGRLVDRSFFLYIQHIDWSSLHFLNDIMFSFNGIIEPHWKCIGVKVKRRLMESTECESFPRAITNTQKAHAKWAERHQTAAIITTTERIEQMKTKN